VITTVTLNPAIDLTLDIKQFKEDDSNRVTSSRKDPGGKGINVSRIAKSLGGSPITLAMLGGFTGEELGNLMRKENIYIWSVNTKEETRTNITITAGDGKQTRLNQKGPNITQAEFKEMLKMIDVIADNSTFLVLSGSLAPGLKSDSYLQMIKRARKSNPDIKIVLDCDGQTFNEGLKGRPYVVKPNEHEAERILNIKIKNEKDLIDACKKLQQKGAQNVVISRGAKGIIALSESGDIYKVLPPKVKVESTVGAGDSFIAGMILSISKGNDFRKSLIDGVATSSAMVQTSGTQIPKSKECQLLNSRVNIEQLK